MKKMMEKPKMPLAQRDKVQDSSAMVLFKFMYLRNCKRREQNILSVWDQNPLQHLSRLSGVSSVMVLYRLSPT